MSSLARALAHDEGVELSEADTDDVSDYASDAEHARRERAQEEAWLAEEEEQTHLFISRLPPLHLCTPCGREPALPAKAPGAPRVTLVLDLDETLVHSVPRGDGEFDVLVRPGAEAFLAAMAAKFDLVVFTASTQPYADPILDSFASLPRSAPRYYRDACTWSPELGLFVKDLRILGLPLDRVRILDNTPQAYSMQPQCGVPIASWTGDPHDRELEKTARLLLANVVMSA